MNPGPPQPPITPTHFINRCTWKMIAALHYNIRDSAIHAYALYAGVSK